MRHPYERLIRIEITSISLAAFIGLFAFIQSYTLLIFLSVYLLALSLVCGALIDWSTHQKTQAIKQFLRAIVLFILTTYLLIKI